jgi:trehalose synthase
MGRQALGGRAVWNVSSTAAGGGVAEMLQVLVGYTLDAGLDVHWLVMSGDTEFFAITKRIHNRLHGAIGDGGNLGPAEAAHYDEVAAANAAGVMGHIRSGDVVILHDPQTAGLASRLTEAGVQVVWRCHVGREVGNEWTDQAWSFLRRHVSACVALVFSLSEYIPPWADRSRVWVIPPSIDPFSPKNEEHDAESVLHALGHIGLLAGPETGRAPTFTRRDGTRDAIIRRASVVSVDDAPLAADSPLVAQVSRWDRLKDMNGVMRGFADQVAGRADVHLALVGPAPNEVSDDPEEFAVFSECLATWHDLPIEARRRVRLVTLPMDDIDENAAMVNAIQRHTTVIVQKSLVEGFGLTVAEAMWKSKAVVASDVGGIAKQVAPGTGLLLSDPTDLRTFGRTVIDLLARPQEITMLGSRARQRVLEAYVGDEHLKHYARLLTWLITA